MGLFLEALSAGYRPKTSPTTVETPTPSNAAETGKEKSHGSLRTYDNITDANIANVAPSIIPITPPAKVSSVDSIKN